MHKIFDLQASVGQDPSKCMSTGFFTNLPCPAAAFVVDKIHCVPFWIVPDFQSSSRVTSAKSSSLTLAQLGCRRSSWPRQYYWTSTAVRPTFMV
jgi:hypothetical protein